METLYDLIYNYIALFLFNSVGDSYEIGAPLGEYTFTIGGDLISMDSWLCHTLTIITMIIAFFLCLMLVRWVWRTVSSAFLLK